MKIYFSPLSSMCRSVLLFCAEAGIEYEPVTIDLFKGEQFAEPLASVSPRHKVPVLWDDGFVLTESAAILRYLAEKHGSPAYPRDLRARARVDEAMDWFNTTFFAPYAYSLVYPQVLLDYRHSHDEAQRSTIEWGKHRAEAYLALLDQHILGDRRFVCGEEITLADYVGASNLTLGELIGVRFGKYPNVERWLHAMKARTCWPAANEAHDALSRSLAATPFTAIG